MKYNQSDWDSRVVNTSSSTVVTPVNDHTAVAAGHYGDLLGDAPRLPVILIAAVPTILPSFTPPTLLFVTCGTMQPSPGGVTRTLPLSPLPFLVATAVFLTWRLCATSLGCPRLTPPLRRALSESSPSCAPFQPCRHFHGCSPTGITRFPCSHPCGPIFWESC